MCCRELVSSGTQTDDPSVVGDECHIVSEKDRGPRSDTQLGMGDCDKHKNLILLCKVHHKVVDDQPFAHTVEYLQTVKSKHEKWVKDCLGGDTESGKTETVYLLPRIRTGKGLMALAAGAYGSQLDHDEPENEEEANLIGDFLQDVQDWGDVWDSIDSGEHVRGRFFLTRKIQALEGNGFAVFATRQTRKIRNTGGIDAIPLLVMTVVRNTNSAITALGTLATVIRT